MGEMETMFSYAGLLYALFSVFISIILTSPKTASLYPSPSLHTEFNPSREGPPIIGIKNASSVISKRVNQVQLSFEAVLQNRSTPWTLLRQIDSMNLSIYWQDNYDGSPPYVKANIFIKADPKASFKLFSWRNLHETLSTIDPFYESTDVLLKLSRSSLVIRKVKE